MIKVTVMDILNPNKDNISIISPELSTFARMPW